MHYALLEDFCFILQKLHERGYERIVIVGHSLGSVIGYDVLTHAWAQYHTAHETRDPAHTALEDLEEAARGDDAEAYRKKNKHSTRWSCNAMEIPGV